MKNKKMWVAAAFVCIVLGIILVMTGRLMGGSLGFYIDSKGLHGAGDEDWKPLKGKMSLEEFDSIEMEVDYADVEIVDSDRFAVEYCLDGGSREPVCEVKNKRLIFKEGDYFRFINFMFSTSGTDSLESEPYFFVRVEIPKNTRLSEVSLDIETGNLSVGSLKAGQIEIKNEYGETVIEEAEGDELKAELDAGSLIVSRLAVSDTEIESEYGDIHLTAVGDLEDHALDLHTEYGSIRAGAEVKKDEYGDEVSLMTEGRGKNRIEVFCECGDIKIDSER